MVHPPEQTVGATTCDRCLWRRWCPVAVLILTIALPRAFAGRPLATDDAEPVRSRTFELEAGWRFDSHPETVHHDFPVALTYGLCPRVEVGVGFGGQVEHRQELEEGTAEVSGVDDLTLGTKIKFLDAETCWASQALSFNVKLPTADEHQGLGSGYPDYDLTWIGSKPLSAKSAVHLNVGYTWVGSDPEARTGNLFHCGVAADYQLTRSLQLVGEVYALHSPGPDSQPAVFFSAGCRYQLRPSLVLDAAFGHALAGEGAGFIGTLGLTWSFGGGAR